jgi:hypothetical protein
MPLPQYPLHLIEQSVQSFPRTGRRTDDRHAKSLRQQSQIQFDVLLACFVHQVDADNGSFRSLDDL